MRALRLAGVWDKLLDTVRWIEQRQALGMYLRQIDVPGVDTKFIERYKGVLTELLDAQLEPSRVEIAAADFAGRYGFLRRPGYVRFRVAGGFRGFSELSVRTDEFAAAPDGITRAYVIENEITYLAFPVPVAAMAILGGGYAVPVLEPLGWLTGLDVVYWGDIDTHGFAILNRLRHQLPGHTLAPDPWTADLPCWATGIIGASSHPRLPQPLTASIGPSQPSTPTSSRTHTPRPSAWNKNGSASLPSRKQSPTVDKRSM